MSLLKLEDVWYSYHSRYQSVDALQGVTCEFGQGTVYGIVGKSGSGKSTMLSLLAGLDVPEKGDVYYEGESTSKMDLNKYRRDCAAVIYQDFKLFPLLTALENVMYPMELEGHSGPEAIEKAKSLLDKVSLPQSVRDRFPKMLSGGEQQRVAIARALSTDRKLILADEPTGNLDSENSRKIIDILIKLAHDDGYCVIIATHDANIIGRMDVVYDIVDGKLFIEKGE